MPKSRLPELRASDVGRYTYCARAWWLERVAEATPTNQAALQRGEQRHEAHGRLVNAAQRQSHLANLLFWLAALLALAGRRLGLLPITSTMQSLAAMPQPVTQPPKTGYWLQRISR